MSSLYEIFHQRFDRPATMRALAPGRVNLIGEHTDYNDGFVLPIAIDRRVEIMADPAEQRLSTFRAVDLRDEIRVDLTREIEPRERGHWSNYLLGVAQQFRQAGAELRNVDLVIQSTVPIGAGLSSSAAVEVAAAELLQHVTDHFLDPVELARLCQRAENDFVGTPCGVMDMLAAVVAEEGHAMLIDCRTLHVKPTPFPPSALATLLVVNTGVRHELATGAYAERRRECEEAADKLGVKSLRAATIDLVRNGSLDEKLRSRALHVVQENWRTLRAASKLRRCHADPAGAREELFEVGQLMFASHRSLREQFEVSCPELDTIVDFARDLWRKDQGVYGARMTGGGFGGCAIILCGPEAAVTIVHRLCQVFRDAHGHTPDVFRTVAAGGAGSVSLA